ncbi:MAG: hypothetical protein ACT4P7_16200 [Gemmatimonadaceae bacterium]
MTNKRFAATVGAAFLVSQILAITVHGFILAADYAPFYGNLLRPMPTDGSWLMLFLPLSHLCFVTGLVWVYGRMQLAGTTVAQGLTLGLAGWLMGQVPLWLLWYAEQPWPGRLVVKQLILELLSSLVVGLTIAHVARRQPAAAPVGGVARGSL